MGIEGPRPPKSPRSDAWHNRYAEPLDNVEPMLAADEAARAIAAERMTPEGRKKRFEETMAAQGVNTANPGNPILRINVLMKAERTIDRLVGGGKAFDEAVAKALEEYVDAPPKMPVYRAFLYALYGRGHDLPHEERLENLDHAHLRATLESREHVSDMTTDAELAKRYGPHGPFWKDRD